MSVVKNDLRYCYCDTKGTSITAAAACLNNKKVYMFFQIVSKKLCHLIPIMGVASSSGIVIRIAQNNNARKIRYMLIEVA